MNGRGLAQLIFYCVFAFHLAVAEETPPWPTEKWELATPESQQIDQGVLDQLHQEFLSGRHGNIDGMAVYRNGYLVYEKTYDNDYVELFSMHTEASGQYQYHDANWHPWFDHSDLHTIQSISKSVTSALIGIAIGRGELSGTDIQVLPFFADYQTPDDDPRRDAITLSDLLTMTSGIRWDEFTTEYTDPRNSAAAMESSSEWVHYVLNQPMRAMPGEEFVYNSGVTVLLSHMLWQATGKHADDYAVEYLFGPLGIKEFYWKKTPTGLVDTEGGLYLRPRDLAKIGYLYLRDGIWDGCRILPENWVAATMYPAVDVPGWDGKYGFQWWLLPYEGRTQNWAYTGLGYGGQRLLVIPEYELVAVFTGWNIDDIPSLDGQFALAQVLQSVGALQ